MAVIHYVWVCYHHGQCQALLAMLKVWGDFLQCHSSEMMMLLVFFDRLYVRRCALMSIDALLRGFQECETLVPQKLHEEPA